VDSFIGARCSFGPYGPIPLMCDMQPPVARIYPLKMALVVVVAADCIICMALNGITNCSDLDIVRSAQRLAPVTNDIGG